MKKFIFLLLILLQNHVLADNQLNVKDIADMESYSDEVKEHMRTAGDDKKGKTPLATISLLREATIKKDWNRAANYIDTRYLSEDIASLGAPELIRRLAIIWQQQKLIDYATLSDQPEGHLDDGLPKFRDLIGELQTTTGTVPIYIQRIPDGDKGQVWRVSNSSLEKVPELWHEFGYPQKIEAFGNWLPKFTLLGMENWQFIAAVILVVGSFFCVYFITAIFAFLFKGEGTFRQISSRFITVGFRWFVYFKLLDFGLNNLGLSLKAKVWLASGLLDSIAGIFLVLGFLEITTAIYLAYAEKTNNKTAKAIVRPLSTTLKVIITLVIIINWLSNAGFNIATLLTGLGIGSLAIALAAQKTLENVFGAFTLYVARPISPGNFCKFGDIMGTVEEIGLRSTRIRTQDRKVVHIPNSEFSSKHLENISEIDRRHFRQELRLELSTPPEAIRNVLELLRGILTQNEKVMEVSRRVQFEKIQPDALILVANAYIDVTSSVEFKKIAEDINLQILDVLAQSGLKLVEPYHFKTLSPT